MEPSAWSLGGVQGVDLSYDFLVWRSEENLPSVKCNLSTPTSIPPGQSEISFLRLFGLLGYRSDQVDFSHFNSSSGVRM